MSHDDLALELRLQKVFPAGRIVQALVGKPVLVAGKGDAAHIDGVPGAGGVQIGRGGIAQCGRLIGLQQALIHSGDVVVSGAAEHQRCLRVVLLGFHTGQHLTSGEADVVDLDAGLFLELVEVVNDLSLGERGVDSQFLASGRLGRGLLGLLFRFLGRLLLLSAAAGGQSQEHHGGHQQCKQTLGGFLHDLFLLFSQFFISIPQGGRENMISLQAKPCSNGMVLLLQLLIFSTG